jgi:hypothetical protein
MTSRGHHGPAGHKSREHPAAAAIPFEEISLARTGSKGGYRDPDDRGDHVAVPSGLLRV